MKVGSIRVGDSQPAARHHALDTEYQPLFAVETADVAFTPGKRAVNHAHYLVWLVCFRIERIVRVRPFQHNHLVGIVLVVVTESTNLGFGYGASDGFFVRRALAVVPDISVGIVVTEKLSQRTLGGKHEHIAVEKGQPLLVVATTHIDLGMRRTIDFQYIPYLALFALDKCAQFRFMSGFGADEKPMIINTVEFVGQHDGFTIYKVLFTAVNPIYNTAKS